MRPVPEDPGRALRDAKRLSQIPSPVDALELEVDQSSPVAAQFVDPSAEIVELLLRPPFGLSVPGPGVEPAADGASFGRLAALAVAQGARRGFVPVALGAGENARFPAPDDSEEAVLHGIVVSDPPALLRQALGHFLLFVRIQSPSPFGRVPTPHRKAEKADSLRHAPQYARSSTR